VLPEKGSMLSNSTLIRLLAVIIQQNQRPACKPFLTLPKNTAGAAI